MLETVGRSNRPCQLGAYGYLGPSLSSRCTRTAFIHAHGARFTSILAAHQIPVDVHRVGSTSFSQSSSGSTIAGVEIRFAGSLARPLRSGGHSRPPLG
jgi:hypothetical protein